MGHGSGQIKPVRLNQIEPATKPSYNRKTLDTIQLNIYLLTLATAGQLGQAKWA